MLIKKVILIYLKTNDRKCFLWNVTTPVAITACTNVATYAMPHWIRAVERSANSGGQVMW